MVLKNLFLKEFKNKDKLEFWGLILNREVIWDEYLMILINLLVRYFLFLAVIFIFVLINWFFYVLGL